MTCSPARLLANRMNAARSTGPRTEEGKAASRANSFKHGLTGDGIVQSPDDAALAATRAEAFAVDLRPTTELGRYLVARVARLSVRVDRCAEREFAEQAKNVGRALDDFDEERQAEADALMLALGDDDPSARRKLMRSPEGLLRMMAAWYEIKAAHRDGRWTEAEDVRARRLAGSTLFVASVDRIEAEIAKLEERAGQIDYDAIDRERAGAPTRALFDPSKHATLARRYEAAAERGFYRAIKELRQVEAQAKAAEEAPKSSSPARGSLASFFPEPSPPRSANPPAQSGPIPTPKSVDPTTPSASVPSSFIPIAVGRGPTERMMA